MIFDVDRFKEYNDRYGHLAGDEVLVAITRAVRQLFKRHTDAVFRLGGEEFGLILEHVARDEVCRLAAKLVDGVAALKIAHEGNGQYGVVTVSLGALWCRPLKGNKPKMGWIYSRCDALMYQVKRRGRNGWACDTLEGDACKETLAKD